MSANPGTEDSLGHSQGAYLVVVMEPGLNSSASGKQNLGSDMLLSTWSDRKEVMEKKVAFFFC